jgi:hypothetical protein
MVRRWAPGAASVDRGRMQLNYPVEFACVKHVTEHYECVVFRGWFRVFWSLGSSNNSQIIRVFLYSSIGFRFSPMYIALADRELTRPPTETRT